MIASEANKQTVGKDGVVAEDEKLTKSTLPDLLFDDSSVPTGPNEDERSTTGAAQQSEESGKEETSTISRLEPDVSNALDKCNQSISALEAILRVCDPASLYELKDNHLTTPTAAQSPVDPEVQEKVNSDYDDALNVNVMYEVRSVTISSNACLVASLHFTAVCAVTR